MLPSAPSPTTSIPSFEPFCDDDFDWIIEDDFDEYESDYAEIDSELGEEDDDFV